MDIMNIITMHLVYLLQLFKCRGKYDNIWYIYTKWEYMYAHFTAWIPYQAVMNFKI